MTPDTLLPIMQAQIAAQLLSMKVSIKLHAGKFIWSELERTSFKAPAVLLSCLGWRAIDDEQAARLGAHGADLNRVRFVAGIVTKSVKKSVSRNQQARLIAQALSTFLSGQDWGLDDVLETQDLRCESLYIEAAENDNQSMWLLDWWHVMSFDAETVASAIDDFITVYGDHFAEPGNYTDDQGDDIPLASDTVTLDQ